VIRPSWRWRRGCGRRRFRCGRLPRECIWAHRKAPTPGCTNGGTHRHTLSQHMPNAYEKRTNLWVTPFAGPIRETNMRLCGTQSDTRRKVTLHFCHWQDSSVVWR
jgi:hypothetical protein